MENSCPKVRVTKKFHFEMAHALYGYDGPCKNIHGHSYQLAVTVIGATKTESESPKHGMVMDFSDLKQIIENVILKKYDHTLVVNGNSPHKTFVKQDLLTGKVILVNYQPTCENLLIDFARVIKENLPDTIKLHHLKLKETPTSFAEWYAEDNK